MKAKIFFKAFVGNTLIFIGLWIGNITNITFLMFLTFMYLGSTFALCDKFFY